jgi:hypothetical protein
MGILDKAKEAAKTVGEKAKEGVAAGQEKVDEAKTKHKIGELKEELGGIVFSQHAGTPAPNADSEISRIVGEIKAAEAHLAE